MHRRGVPSGGFNRCECSFDLHLQSGLFRVRERHHHRAILLELVYCCRLPRHIVGRIHFCNRLHMQPRLHGDCCRYHHSALLRQPVFRHCRILPGAGNHCQWSTLMHKFCHRRHLYLQLQRRAGSCRRADGDLHRRYCVSRQMERIFGLPSCAMPCKIQRHRRRCILHLPSRSLGVCCGHHRCPVLYQHVH